MKILTDARARLARRFLAWFPRSRRLAEETWRGELQRLDRLVEERRFDQLEPTLHEIELRVEALFPEASDYVRRLNEVAELFQDLVGDFQNAERLLRKALRRCESQEGLAPETILTLNNLGLLYLRERRGREAAATFQRLLPMVETQFGPNHVETASCLENLAAAYRQLGKTAEAARHKGRALRIRRGEKPTPAPTVH